MDIALSSGHGAKVSGAAGYIVEVPEARKVCDRVGELIRANGGVCKVYHENSATSVSGNLNNIGAWHKQQRRDLDVSVHFNAFKTQAAAVGTECLHKNNSSRSAKVAAAMARAGGFINRGAKYRSNLYFLNTFPNGLLLEVCFVDSQADVNAYKKNFEAICAAIAESIADVKIGAKPEPPPPPPPPPAPEVTGDHVVDVAITVTGNPTVVINGDKINDGLATSRLDLTLAHQGDILVTIDGEDFQVERPPSSRPMLRKGSTGEQVRLLQTALGVRPIDGDFGPITETAVKGFQKEYGLDADGIVGVQTWTKLEQIYNLPPFEAPAVTWFENIITTVFGGSKDPNNSAYSPFDKITDTERSVALPYKFQGTRPKVLVRNRANGKEVVCGIRDVGPWLIDDPYWQTGSRPLAETCWRNKTPLPRGPHKGKVPNGGGLDLTPGAANAIGLSGKGNVDWRFE